MNNLQRRPSGMWVARPVVPKALRGAVGRREFIQSPGTQNATIAKLVAATSSVDGGSSWPALRLGRGFIKHMNDEVLRLVE